MHAVQGRILVPKAILPSVTTASMNPSNCGEDVLRGRVRYPQAPRAWSLQSIRRMARQVEAFGRALGSSGKRHNDRFGVRGVIADVIAGNTQEPTLPGFIEVLRRRSVPTSRLVRLPPDPRARCQAAAVSLTAELGVCFAEAMQYALPTLTTFSSTSPQSNAVATAWWRHCGCGAIAVL